MKITFKYHNSFEKKNTNTFAAIALIFAFVTFVTGANLPELIKELNINFLIAFLKSLLFLSPIIELITLGRVEGLNSNRFRHQFKIYLLLIALLVIADIVLRLANSKFTIYQSVFLNWWWNQYSWNTISLGIIILFLLSFIKIRIGSINFSFFYNSNMKTVIISTFSLLTDNNFHISIGISNYFES